MSEDGASEEYPVTEQMVLDILKKIEKTDDVRMVDFRASPGSGKGENWSSLLIR
jgi:hypothetical protein